MKSATIILAVLIVFAFFGAEPLLQKSNLYAREGAMTMDQKVKHQRDQYHTIEVRKKIPSPLEGLSFSQVESRDLLGWTILQIGRQILPAFLLMFILIVGMGSWNLAHQEKRDQT